LKLMWE